MLWHMLCPSRLSDQCFLKSPLTSEPADVITLISGHCVNTNRISLVRMLDRKRFIRLVPRQDSPTVVLFWKYSSVLESMHTRPEHLAYPKYANPSGGRPEGHPSARIARTRQAASCNKAIRCTSDIYLTNLHL